MIASYPSLVKNMRAIIYAEKIDDEQAKFVSKYHRNRSVGVLDKNLLKNKKCAITLTPPTHDIGTFIEKIRKRVGIFAVHVAYASLYLAPIILFAKPKRTLEIFKICAKEDSWNIANFLRHLRIAEYFMIDFCQKFIDIIAEYGTYNAEMLTKINNQAKVDLKRRFWRVWSDNGHVVGFCSTLLVSELGRSKKCITCTFPVVSLYPPPLP
ncbi:MAG: hypothetical protein DRN20_03350 [Thermoplasmata archaeon]|nr:MAG: hypothetical protein DRN20_03350 [Thermoplasmata archaeon]